MNQAPRPAVEFLVLADRAEAVNGKLYMLGGGWDRINIADFRQPTAVSVAVGILVPQEYAERALDLRIYWTDLQGNALGPEIRGQVVVTKPEGTPEVMPLRAVVAVNALWGVVEPGVYRVRAQIDESEPAQMLFHVAAAQPEAGR
jgi:hypothetical protein